jgi:glutamate-ammonia-ligase adenylyltransferase
LRDLENKIQISFGLQTHCIPAHVEDQMVLARKMGIRGVNQKDAAEKLLNTYQGHSQNVHKIFDDLFKSKENHEKKFHSESSSNETEINTLLKTNREFLRI